MKIAKLFKNGHSQAVTQPKEFRFECTEVLVKRCGNCVQLIPRHRSWATLLAGVGKFYKNAIGRRREPRVEARESFE